MGRKATIPDHVRDRARKLRAAGKSRDEVRTALAGEGYAVSAGWLSGVFAARGKSPPPKREHAEVVVPTVEVAELVAGATLDDARRYLGQLGAALESALRDAHGAAACESCGRGGADVDALTKIGRGLTAAAREIARHQPPTPPDPEEHPDMQAAAQRAREKLEAMVAEAVRAAPGPGPRTPTAGRTAA